MPYFYLVLLFVFSHALWAKDSEEQVIYFPKNQIVELGVFVTDLRNFDYSKNAFDIIFYAWWNSTDKEYRPDKIVEITHSYSFEYKNNFRANYVDKIYNTSLRYFATVEHNWNMAHFPFDRQILNVYLEDGLSDIESIKFVPDVKNSMVSKNIVLDGWDLQNFSIKEAPNTYRTNFGNGAIKQATFSRVTLRFDIKRWGLREFINYFIGFFIAVFLIALAYFISPTNTDQKLSLSLSSIFAAMANKYILDNFLPITHNFTLSDGIQYASFAFIIIGTSIFTLESILMLKNRIWLCRKINYSSFALSIVTYLLFVVFITYRAVSS